MFSHLLSLPRKASGQVWSRALCSLAALGLLCFACKIVLICALEYEKLDIASTKWDVEPPDNSYLLLSMEI